MSATDRATRELASWPDNARVAYLFESDHESRELILTVDGRAILDGRHFRVAEYVPIAELRAGRAAARAGLL